MTLVVCPVRCSNTGGASSLVGFLPTPAVYHNKAIDTSVFVVYLQRKPAAYDNRGMAERKATVRTTVLLPVDLHATLKEIADRDRRSLHREIIYALERFAAEQVEQAKPEPRP